MERKESGVRGGSGKMKLTRVELENWVNGRVRYDKELQSLFDSLNDLHWDGKLPKAVVAWAAPRDESGKPLAGSYRGFSALGPSIHISWMYGDDPARVRAILLHEMIHHYVSEYELDHGHDSLFMKEVRRLRQAGEDVSGEGGI